MSNYSLVSIDGSTSTIDLDNQPWIFYTYFVVDCTTGSVNITLPSVVTDGLYMIFNKIDNSSNTLTLTANTGQLIKGSSSLVISGISYCEACSVSGNWIAPQFLYS